MRAEYQTTTPKNTSVPSTSCSPGVRHDVYSTNILGLVYTETPVAPIALGIFGGKGSFLPLRSECSCRRFRWEDRAGDVNASILPDKELASQHCTRATSSRESQVSEMISR